MIGGTQPANSSVVLLLATAAVLCVFPVTSMAASQYFDTRENVSYRCIVDDYQGDVAVDENALIEAHVTAFPAGRLCVWDGADGGQVAHQTGWLFTTVGIVGTAVGFVVLLALMRFVGSLRARWLAALPFLVTASVWLLVFSYGSSASPYIR